MKDLMVAWKDAKYALQKCINRGNPFLGHDEASALDRLEEELQKLENVRPIDEMLEKKEKEVMAI